MGEDVAPGGADVNAAPKGLMNKILLTAIALMGLFALVLVGFAVWKIGGGHRSTAAQPAASAPPAARIALPAGAQIESLSVSGDRLVVRLRHGQSEEIDLFDTADGHLVARIAAPR